MSLEKGPDCWSCGQDRDFQIDGYHFGDRLLEGVMFTVIFENNSIEVTYPGWEKDSYMSGINTPYWCSYIKEQLEKSDHDDMLFCIHCKKWMA